MKNKLIVILMLSLAACVYAQDYETPAVMIEVNSGYALGIINYQDAIPVEIKFTTYTYKSFGFTAEAGVLLGDNISFHSFFGPTFFIINSARIRLPLSLGLDVFLKDGNEAYLGAAGILSFHFVILKNLYAGINVSANYSFIGIEDKRNNTIGFYNNFYVKPTIGIGLQL